MSVYAGPADWWTDGIDAGRIHIATKGIVTSGLVFNIDVGTSSTYPGTGTTLFDLKSNHNFRLLNGPTYNSADNYGAIVLDGTNDYMDVPNGIPLGSPISLTDNFTIEQVFKPTAYQTSSYFGLANMLIQKGTASTYNYATQAVNDTTFRFTKRTSPENLQNHNFTVPSMLDKVNVVTIVIQNGNDSANDTVSCYHNSNFISTLAISGLALAAVNNEPLYLGGLSSTQYTSFIGSFYSVRIYNRALTSAEIAQNFNATRGRYNI